MRRAQGLQRSMAEIKRIRHCAGLATAGQALDIIRFEQSRGLIYDDGPTDHCITQYRAVTHQA